MTGQEYADRLYDLTFTCGMNQRYHQRLKQIWAILDKFIKIVVGVFAVFGLVLAIPSMDNGWGLPLAIVSLIAAIALNIVPVGDWEKTHAELFRLWSELRKDVEVETAKASRLDPDDKISNYLEDRICEMTSKEHSLNADEPAPWNALLLKCHADEIEARFGNGIRTFEEVERLRAKELASQSTSASGAAEVKV